MFVTEVLHRLNDCRYRIITVEGIAATDLDSAWMAHCIDEVGDRHASILLDVSQRCRDQLLVIEAYGGGPIAFARPAIVRGVIVNDEDGHFGAKLTAIESLEVNSPDGTMVAVTCQVGS